MSISDQVVKLTGEGSTVVSLKVPERLVRHAPDDLERWLDCREAWRQGRGRDWSGWANHWELWDLFSSGRYHFAHPRDGGSSNFRQGRHPYGWPECVAALDLQKQGFTCWTGVHLFGRPTNSPQRRANTEDVERRLQGSGFIKPRVLQSHIFDPLTQEPILPKNPDLVAFHETRREWLFCEVKRRESIQPQQLTALALLHWVTGARVEIVRVRPEGREDKTRVHPTEFRYHGLPPKRL